MIMSAEAVNVESINCVKDVVIPLLSAFIGGFITLAGVWLTIHRDKKRDEDNKKQSAKPWIYSLDRFEDYDHTNVSKYIMATSSNLNNTHLFQIIVKNTDNGICILDELVTEKKRYIPICGKVIDKDHVIHLNVHIEEGETLKEMYLYVKDIYGNRYKYKVYQTKKGNYIEEVIGEKANILKFILNN